MADLKYYDVIQKPIVTEKSMHPESTKPMIKEAVEKMFEGTKVRRVNTMNCPGKKKRRGTVVGRTAKTKKAMVFLTEDSKEIEIFEGL